MADPDAAALDALATRLFDAIERNDLAAVRALYHPEVAVWHAASGRTQDREANLSLLERFAARVADRRYEVTARDFFPGGFVQRHVLHGRTASGEAIEARACVVVYVRDGRVHRLYEYLDPAAVAPAFRRGGGPG